MAAEMEAYNSAQRWRHYVYSILYKIPPCKVFKKICINRGNVKTPALSNVNETEVLGCQKSVQ